MSEHGASKPSEHSISEDLDPFDGRWVAMRNGRVVTHAHDEETLRALHRHEPGDLLFPVGHPTTGFYMLNV